MEENEKREIESIAKKEKRSFQNGLFTGVMATVLVVTMVFCIKQVVVIYGNRASIQTAQKENSGKTTEKETETTVVNDEVFEKMEAIEKVIDYYYYEEGIDRAVIEEGVYDGMVSSLGDPYSTYYSEEELADIMAAWRACSCMHPA